MHAWYYDCCCGKNVHIQMGAKSPFTLRHSRVGRIKVSGLDSTLFMRDLLAVDVVIFSFFFNVSAAQS